MMKQINLLNDDNTGWNTKIKLGKAYHIKMNKVFDGDAILVDKIPDILTFYGAVGFFTLNINTIVKGEIPTTIFEME